MRVLIVERRQAGETPRAMAGAVAPVQPARQATCVFTGEQPGAGCRSMPAKPSRMNEEHLSQPVPHQESKKRNTAANFRAINPGNFRVPARTVYSLGRKYEISALVRWPSKRRSHWCLRTAMREFRCGRAGAADSKPRPKWRASRPRNLDLET